jgi:cytoskeleton protein RodZ
VFEIGNSLREARLRQGFDLPRVETDTKIRAKYLRALEEEKFAVLPAETYVKGFLRTYAEYLGLDGQLYVDEFNSRFAREDEPAPAASSSPRRPRSRPVESNFIVVTLAGIFAVTILVVVAWRFSSGESRPDPLVPSNLPQETTSTPAPTGSVQTETAPAEAKPRLARLVVAAARGDCWIRVKTRSATGRLLYEGTVEQGQVKRFARERLWIEVGAPANLNVRLNGRRVRNFPTGPAIVVVTAKGVRTVSTA